MTSLHMRSGPRSPRRHRYLSFRLVFPFYFFAFIFLSCTCVCVVFFHGYFEVQTDRQTRAHMHTQIYQPLWHGGYSLELCVLECSGFRSHVLQDFLALAVFIPELELQWA